MKNPWKRNYLVYSCVLVVENRSFRTEITKHLDFISYHLIKFIHGEKKLIEMANKQ